MSIVWSIIIFSNAEQHFLIESKSNSYSWCGSGDNILGQVHDPFHEQIQRGLFCFGKKLSNTDLECIVSLTGSLQSTKNIHIYSSCNSVIEKPQLSEL